LINASINVGIIYEMDGGSPEFGGLAASINAAYGGYDGAYALRTLQALGAPQGTVVYGCGATCAAALDTAGCDKALAYERAGSDRIPAVP
jgi:hypothetical protein